MNVLCRITEEHGRSTVEN